MDREHTQSNRKAVETLAFRLKTIEAKHRLLDERVAELARRGFLTPDEQRQIHLMKRQKLRAKDEIASLRRALG